MKWELYLPCIVVKQLQLGNSFSPKPPVPPPHPPPPFVWEFVFFNISALGCIFSTWHLLNLSVQNALDCISQNFNLENFPGGTYARISLEKCAVRNPDWRYRPHIVTVYYISWPPLSQILRQPLLSLSLSLSLSLFFFFHLLVYKYDNNWGLNSDVEQSGQMSNWIGLWERLVH